MREIKFRAWNKSDKIMESVEDIFWYHKDGGVSHINSKNLNNSEVNYELMQFTGLKDKNGKEIYEGDILEYPYDYKLDTSVIVFDDCGFCTVDIDKYDKPVKIDGVSRYLLYANKLGTYLKDLKVIGNIYENPELLEEK